MESAKKLAAKLPDSIAIIKNGVAEGGSCTHWKHDNQCLSSHLHLQTFIVFLARNTL